MKHQDQSEKSFKKETYLLDELGRLKTENFKLMKMNKNWIVNNIKGKAITKIPINLFIKNLGFEHSLKMIEHNIKQQSKDKDTLLESKFNELSQLYQVLQITNEKLQSIELQKQVSVFTYKIGWTRRFIMNNKD